MGQGRGTGAAAATIFLRNGMLRISAANGGPGDEPAAAGRSGADPWGTMRGTGGPGAVRRGRVQTHGKLLQFCR